MPEAGKFKIHFAAMIGVSFDADIFHYWIPHYKRLQLASYSVFLHESADAKANWEAEQLFISHGFCVKLLPESSIRDNPISPGDPGKGVRAPLLDMVNLALPKTDFLITADGDEFQVWDKSPYDYLDRGIRLVTGELIDCFDDTLHAPDPAKSLRENYPTEVFNLSKKWREFPYNTRKICLSPAGYPVNFSGSHEVKRNHGDVAARVVGSGPIPVLHYRWRETALSRVKTRSNWPPEEIAYIKQFFQVEG